jgi:hypothetical protein
MWTFDALSAEGSGSPGEELAGCGLPARCSWVTLWRKAKLEERVRSEA